MEKKMLHFPETIFTIHQVLILVSILVKELSLNSMSFLQDFVGFFTCMSVLHDDHEDQKQQQQQQAVQNAASVQGLRRGDLELILSRTGLDPSEEDEGEDLYELLPNLFAEEEPSLDELRQAFFVFDKNDDGFIDAGELRSVLSELGFGDQRLDLDACERMIQVHDRNGDGVMDFGEFLRFMEIGLC